MPRALDLTGQRFGRLIAVKSTERRVGKSVVWECRCDCGKTMLAPAGSLKNGLTRSCGCLLRETALDHLKPYYVDGTCVKALLQSPGKRNTSGVVGVSHIKDDNTWCAYITFKHHRYRLGRRKKKEDAIALRKEAEQHLHGDFLAWYYAEHPNRGPK